MPELPEVETTRRGLEPHLCNTEIVDLVVRHSQLRWPIAADLATRLRGQTIHGLKRRAKYLLLEVGAGHLMIHLGMSGTLRVVSRENPVGKHDHADIILADGALLRFNDPRRFGSILWVEGDPHQHKLLAHLGPEPLSHQFDGSYLMKMAAGRRRAVKVFLLDQKVVVGVGNIYANEALFRAKISPWTQVSQLSLGQWETLAAVIQQTLSDALAAGGTTLKDFVDSEGRPGYFAQQLTVYGREGETCLSCGHTIGRAQQGQRSTWFCPQCQQIDD